MSRMAIFPLTGTVAGGYPWVVIAMFNACHAGINLSWLLERNCAISGSQGHLLREKVQLSQSKDARNQFDFVTLKQRAHPLKRKSSPVL